MIELLKQAIDYIENVPDDRDSVGHINRDALVLSLNQAIAELESQEPVEPTEKIYKAWDILVGQHKDLLEENKKLRDQSYDLLGQLKVANIKLSYTTPPQRTEQLKACVYCGQLVAKEKNT